MEEKENEETEVKLPEERVEDLEPEAEESDDVTGGIVLKRGADTNR
jgi:hypothetical protein